MRTAALLLMLFTATLASAQDSSSNSATKPEPVDESAVADGGLKKDEASDSPVSADQKKLFDKFIKSMKNTVMVGSFTIDGDKESKRREERYEIKRVVKADRGDYWNIFARMKFGSVDATLPFPVEVKWAGSTPVITVDELKLIGMGDAFDARVLIADGKYAGTWSHGKVGGLMYGRIEKAEKSKTEKPKAEDTESE